MARRTEVIRQLGKRVVADIIEIGRLHAVQWLACALPCRRFAGALADVCARLRADAGRYSFTVRDFHPLLLAGLPAHSENLHSSGHPNQLDYSMGGIAIVSSE
jgi:hypothetical protein